MTDTDTPLYEGTKQLRAKPMSKADYCAYRGWAVPANEDPSEAGYFVEYQDGGKPNDDRHQGYISWSPADVFARSYHRCDTHIERMEIEWSQLYERVDKLREFVTGNPTFGKLTAVDQGLLMAQLNAMETYKSVLSLRLGSVADQRVKREPLAA